MAVSCSEHGALHSRGAMPQMKRNQGANRNSVLRGARVLPPCRDSSSAPRLAGAGLLPSVSISHTHTQPHQNSPSFKMLLFEIKNFMVNHYHLVPLLGN